MKSKIKRHSRSVLSVVLTLCMLVSCMTVGLIATDAAKLTDSGSGVTQKFENSTTDDDTVGAKFSEESNVGAGEKKPDIFYGNLNGTGWKEYSTSTGTNYTNYTRELYIKRGDEFLLKSTEDANRYWHKNSESTLGTNGASMQDGGSENVSSNADDGVYTVNIKWGGDNDSYQYPWVWFSSASTPNRYVRLNNGESWEATPMSFSEGVYSVTYSNIPAGSQEYKLTSDTSWALAPSAGDTSKISLTIDGDAGSVSGGGNNNVTFTTTAVSDITFTYNLNSEETAINVTSSTPSVTYKLHVNNDSTGVDMTAVSDNSIYYYQKKCNTNDSFYITDGTNTFKAASTYNVSAMDTKVTLSDSGNQNVQFNISNTNNVYVCYKPATKEFWFSTTQPVASWPPSFVSSLTTTPNDRTVIFNNGNNGTVVANGASGRKVVVPKSNADKTDYWADMSSIITNFTANNVNHMRVALSDSADGSTDGINNSYDATAEYVTNSILGTANVSNYNFQDSTQNARVAYAGTKNDYSIGDITHLGVRIQIGSNTITYTFYTDDNEAPTPVVTTVDVTAKDGAIRTTDDYGPYTTLATIATTTLSDTVVRDDTNTSITVTNHTYSPKSGGGNVDANQNYMTATVNAGDIIHVSTQIDDAHKATHYVKGFVVNGETKKLNTWNSTGLYELDYEVTGEERNGKLEITPVYFLKDESNTINFSIDGFEPALQFNNNGTAKWGDTLYVYPFYENGGKNITGRLNAFGSYPGQPLIFEGGKYYIQIPKTISYTDGDTTKTATVKGVTMSNGFWDHVHRGIMGWGNGNENHRQTYDYDDFYKISKERTPDNITFDFKYRTSVANNGISTNSTYSSFSTDTFKNGFDDLEDVYGRKIDVFGNLLTTAQQALSPVYVVSKGYHKTNAGDYATEWEIFYPNANTVESTTTWTKSTATSGSTTLSAINPAALVLENSSKFATYGVEAFSKYKPLYEALDTQKDGSNNTLVKGHPVKITFEMEVQNTEGDIAQRSDGQWYHSKNNDIIHANIIIEYKNASGNWVADTFSPDNTENPTGVTTGASAYFTNEENNIAGQSFYGKRATGDVYSNNKEFFTFAAESSATYKFVGWKRLLNGNYYDITGDAQSPKTTIDTYVARFEPFVGGSLTVKNTVSTAGNYKGSGTSYVKLDVINTNAVNASSVYSTGFVKNSAALDSTYIKENSNKFVRITLKTEPSGEDTFQQFSYKNGESTTTSAVETYFPDGGTTEGAGFTLDGTTATKTFVIPISGLFSGGAPTKSLLEYFSELNKTELKYELKYKYDGRLFGDGANSQWYVVKGTFTSKEFSDYVTKTGENYYIASSFLLNKKPYERDFMKDITWNYNVASETPAKVDTPVANTKTLKLDINQNADQADSARTAIFTLPYCYNPSTNYGVNEYIPVAKYEERAGSTSGTYYYNMIGYWYTPDDDGFDEYQTEVASWHGDNKPYESIDENSFLPAKHNGIPVKEGSSVPTFDISTVYGKRFVIGNYPEGEAANDEANYNYINAAPSVYNNTSGKVEYFKYWQITNYDGKEIAKCYYNKFNFSAYDNYMIEAVYGEGDPGQNYTLGGNEALGATISFLDSSRNHWNEDGKGKSSYTSADILFKDFAVAYSYKSKILKYYTDEDVRVGVVIERVQDELDTVGGSYYLNMDYYKDKHSDTESTAIDNIKSKLSTGSGDSKYIIKKIASNIASDSGYKNISEDQVIDNKNRTKYYYAVYNEANGTSYDNKKRLYRAYSYIMVKSKDSDTWDTDNIAVSEKPVYFAFYDIASK